MSPVTLTLTLTQTNTTGGRPLIMCPGVFKGQLYLLVTDQGFLTEEKVVWESLHNVDGDGNFCDSEFRLRPPSDPETVYRGQQDQIDQVKMLR